MTTLHPIFAAICSAHTGLPKAAQQIERTAYEAMLHAHDWSYEFSEDATVYRQGRFRFTALKAAQKNIDGDGAIWNKHAPKAYQIGSLEARDAPILAARIKELM